ncbi:MAG: CPBP family intramembrane metalloprotease [Oscillospiraceae bacterium]|jgi:membrane protease YdiL (CAAX protease family)|nr:CPBP family intramembrane metalloprotease [Oscillospiraceae bacterium]
MQPYYPPPFYAPQISPAAIAKTGLRRAGNLTAAGLLAFELIGVIIMIPVGMLSLFGVNTAGNSFLVMLACNGLAAFLALYCVFSGLMKPLGCRDEVGKAFGKPISGVLVVCAVIIGFALALCSDLLTNGLMWVLQQLQVPTEMPDFEPETLSGANIAMFVVQIAISPALLEEFAFRGVMMQSLRRYGDGFAIVASALVFGVFHGNIVQAPFAFLLGLAMGYLAIATGSIWTSVLIHFANNFNSVMLSIYQQREGAEALGKVYYIELIVALLLGAIAAIIFIADKNRQKLSPSPVGVPKKGRMSAFLLNPGMIILFVLLIGNALATMFLSDILNNLGNLAP